LLERGAALKANRIEDIPFRLEKLMGSTALLELGQKATLLGKPHAAEDICRAVEALLHPEAPPRSAPAREPPGSQEKKIKKIFRTPLGQKQGEGGVGRSGRRGGGGVRGVEGNFVPSLTGLVRLLNASPRVNRRAIILPPAGLRLGFASSSPPQTSRQ